MTLRHKCQLIVLAANVGGCTRTAPIDLRPTDEMPMVQQETSVLRLETLRGPERYHLRNFVASASRGRLDTVHLDITGSTSLGAQVAREARAMGVVPYNIQMSRPDLAQPIGSAVRVEATAYAVHPPTCRALTIAGPAVNDNSFDRALGCSIRNNLATMVNDPHDLLDNHVVMPTNGDRAATPVATYRAFGPRNQMKSGIGTINMESPETAPMSTNEAQPAR